MRLVLCSLVLLASTPGLRSAPLPDKVLPARLLAVSAEYKGNSEILLLNPDSGDVTNLTKHPSGDHDPVWSPDGKKIAFVSDRDGAANVYVMNADGSGVWQVTKEKVPCSWVRWSPDGGKLAFVHAGAGRDNVYVADVTSGKVTQLTGEAVPSRQPAWSPDGKRISYAHYVFGPYETYAMNADGSDKKNLTRGGGLDAVWSPDGKKIAFTSIRGGGGFRLYVMDADGSNVTAVSTNNNTVGNVFPAWSPDGKEIAFTDLVGGILQAAVVGVDGKGHRVLAKDGSSAFPRWSPDGKTISFTRYEDKKPAALWISNQDGKDLRKLLDSYGSASWKPR